MLEANKLNLLYFFFSSFSTTDNRVNRKTMHFSRMNDQLRIRKELKKMKIYVVFILILKIIKKFFNQIFIQHNKMHFFCFILQTMSCWLNLPLTVQSAVFFIAFIK